MDKIRRGDRGRGQFITRAALVVFLLGAALPALAQPPTELFFSEYVEGSSNNKALEIFNGTGAAVDLAAGGYDAQIFSNGSATATTTIALTGTVADGDVYVVANSSATGAVTAAADQLTGSVNFNGNDAVVLRRGGTVIDSIGQVGVDPGSEWSGGGIGTQNETLRRKVDVCAGDAVATDAFDPSHEWDGFTQDTFGGLGGHLQTCTGPIVPMAAALLLTEVVVTPTAGEYVEIHNPTGTSVDLSLYYLTDATFAPGGDFYYNIVTGADAGGGGFGDFHARFPDGASIASGEYQTVAMAGSDDFFSVYGVAPTYELYEDAASADGIPDMREALPGAIAGQGGLSDSGEVVVFYFWDGDTDLVIDVDYALWGDKAEAVDKTGVSIDGPDVDGVASAYLGDTAISLQDVIAGGSHGGGNAFQRADPTEGTETQTGGNGVGGNDETSENLSVTWSSNAAPTPGNPVPSDWVINEFLSDPASGLAGDANGDGVRDATDDEFVEIVNNTGAAVDISGWTLSDAGGVKHVFPSGTVVADQCSVVVFGGGSPTGAFGNSIVQTASTGSVSLNNGGDSIFFNDGTRDRATASYTSSLGGANQSGTLDPDVTGLPPYVRHSLATGSGGALFSPGTRIDGSGFGGCPTPWVINEIHADPANDLPGDANGDGVRNFDDDEFVEIVNNTGGDVDISGWTFSDDSSVRHVFPPGTVVRDGCSVVVFGGNTPTGAFGNSVVQVASTGSLSLRNSGDALSLSDGSSTVATAGYGPEGGSNQSLTLDPDVVGFPPYVLHTLATGSGGALYSPGTRIDGSQFAGCPVAAEIYEIQGEGAASPLEDRLVSTEDNVVTGLAPNGFFMQTPASRSDGDIDTSDGIFVFTGAPPPVAVGDLVDVLGTVDEFFGFTEITSPEITVDGTGSLPAAVAFNAAVPSTDPTAPSCAIEFECYEGMRVEVLDGTVTGPNQRFNPDPIAEVFVTAAPARTFREPGVEFPGLMPPMAPIPTWDGNPEIFELDPDRLGLPNQIIPAGSSFSASGVLGFEFGGYELWPTFLDVTLAPLPDAVRDRIPGEMTVGTLNLFRLFDDVDDAEDPPGSGRDDFVVPTAEYQLRLAKLSVYIRDILRSPDVLAVQEVEKLGVLADLAARIQADDPSVVYSAWLVEGNDVGTIDVGFLTRQRIEVDAVTQLGKDETFVNPITLEEDVLHDRPPLLLEGRCRLEFGSFPISVMTVHNRSLGGIDGSEGQRVRVKRLRQAESIAEKVQSLQNADPAVRLVVLGDFNAYEFTDGYADAVSVVQGDFDPATSLVCSEVACAGDLVEPDLTNQVEILAAEERYSFIFRGNAQVLDHALTSEGLFEVSGAAYGRGNADAAVDLINDDGAVVDVALRSSDHDGLVLYVLKDEDDDGVPNDDDFCPATAIPEGVPTVRLGQNRYALVDGDRIFDIGGDDDGDSDSDSDGPPPIFTLGDTGGCSCEQIIVAQGLGKGHVKFGCSLGEMEDWVGIVAGTVPLGDEDSDSD